MGPNQRLLLLLVSRTVIFQIQRAYESILNVLNTRSAFQSTLRLFFCYFSVGPLFLFNCPSFCRLIFAPYYTKFVLMLWQRDPYIPTSAINSAEHSRAEQITFSYSLDFKSLFNFDNVSYKHWPLALQCSFEGEQSNTLFDVCIPLNYPLYRCHNRKC